MQATPRVGRAKEAPLAARLERGSQREREADHVCGRATRRRRWRPAKVPRVHGDVEHPHLEQLSAGALAGRVVGRAGHRTRLAEGRVQLGACVATNDATGSSPRWSAVRVASTSSAVAPWSSIV